MSIFQIINFIVFYNFYLEIYSSFVKINYLKNISMT